MSIDSGYKREINAFVYEHGYTSTYGITITPYDGEIGLGRN
jgi:hypothetical protein